MKTIQVFLGLLCGLTAIGCGGSDGPALYPVEGIVTYNDKPLNNASVVFMPEEGQVAIGRTDETGRYQLNTQGTPGANEGEFTVVITATEQLKEVSAEDAESLTDQERAQLNKSLIPEKYGDAKKSGLSATVAPGEENAIDFALEG